MTAGQAIRGFGVKAPPVQGTPLTRAPSVLNARVRDRSTAGGVRHAEPDGTEVEVRWARPRQGRRPYEKKSLFFIARPPAFLYY